jgi:hypothetical protein
MDRTIIRQFTDEIGKIKEFLQYYERLGGIEPCILDFLEQLSLFTKMTFSDFTQILGGAYTIIRGDGGRIFRKFKKNCEQKKFSMGIRYPTSVAIETGKWYIPTSLSVETKFWDWVPMSSHGKYMTDAFRMGAGELVLCDKDSLYKTDYPMKNPKFDILVGKSISEGFEGDTCFQFESCRMDDLINFVKHGLVYFEYKRVGKNVGAFGYSAYKDSDPLVIDACSGGNICPRLISR